MADQLKQIKEFPNKADFGDEDLLLIQGTGITYNVKGSSVKQYAEDSAKPQVELAAAQAQAAAQSAKESAASAVRSETAVEHPPMIDYATGVWLVWDRTGGAYVPTGIRAVGKNFEILGYYGTLEELAAVVTDPEPGDAYGVGEEPPYDVYIWDGVNLVWKNNGTLLNSGDMTQSVYDPEKKRTDIFAYADQKQAKAVDVNIGETICNRVVLNDAVPSYTFPFPITLDPDAIYFLEYKYFGTDGLPDNANAGAMFSMFRENIGVRWLSSDENNSLTLKESGITDTWRGEGKSAIVSIFKVSIENFSELVKISICKEGYLTFASGLFSHAEGQSTSASGTTSHAEGYLTRAEGRHSHAEGYLTKAEGLNSHAEGYLGIAEGSASHVEGGQVAGDEVNKATGYAAHAEGASTLASGDESHAEGLQTTASGKCAHSEGSNGIASGIASHVEGGFIIGYSYNKASGYAAHAEGSSTEASGEESHAEGDQTTASGAGAHAEGYGTVASGNISHAGGANTIASSYGQTVVGIYNVEYPSSSPADRNSAALFIVGKGTASARANALRVGESGVWAAGSYNASGADYAERFEWADGNPDGEDRAGLFVTLAGPHIRIAGPEDGYLLGIVSGSPSIVGDVYDDQWKGMYLTDVFGRPLWEEVEVPAVTEEHDILEMADTGRTDEAGNPVFEEIHRKETVVLIPAHTERRQKLNPAYDPAQTYIPQSARPEKENVGLLGKLVALEDGSCQVDGWCTAGEGGRATASAERTRFRVMEKLTDPDTGRKCVRVMILNA